MTAPKSAATASTNARIGHDGGRHEPLAARPAGGRAATVCDSETRARARRSRTASRSGSTGTPRSTPARTSVAQSDGGGPARPRAPLDALLQLLDVVERVELHAAVRSASRAKPVDLGRLANRLPHDAATTGGRRPRPASSPPATAATRVRRRPCWPVRTTARRPGSPAATSSARSPMSCMYSHLSGRAPNPFSRSAMARSGRPAPPGYGSARKIEPKR